MDMIEASEVPMDVVQHYFGSHVNSLHEIRVDLLQVIDRVKRKKSRQQLKIDKERQIREIGYNLLNRRVDDMTFTKGGLEGAQHRMRKLAIGREPITMHPYRPEPTTPYEILNILKVVDIRQKRAQKKRPDVAAMNPRSVTSEFSSQFGYETTRGAPQSDTHHDDKLGWKPVKARKDVSLESPKPKKPTRDIKTSFGARKLGTSAEGSGILAPRNVLCMLKPSQLARPRTVA